MAQVQSMPAIGAMTAGSFGPGGGGGGGGDKRPQQLPRGHIIDHPTWHSRMIDKAKALNLRIQKAKDMKAKFDKFDNNRRRFENNQLDQSGWVLSSSKNFKAFQRVYGHRTPQRQVEMVGDRNWNDTRPLMAIYGYRHGIINNPPCDNCQRQADPSTKAEPVFTRCVSVLGDPSNPSKGYMMKGTCMTCEFAGQVCSLNVPGRQPSRVPSNRSAPISISSDEDEEEEDENDQITPTAAPFPTSIRSGPVTRSATRAQTQAGPNRGPKSNVSLSMALHPPVQAQPQSQAQSQPETPAQPQLRTQIQHPNQGLGANNHINMRQAGLMPSLNRSQQLRIPVRDYQDQGNREVLRQQLQAALHQVNSGAPIFGDASTHTGSEASKAFSDFSGSDGIQSPSSLVRRHAEQQALSLYGPGARPLTSPVPYAEPEAQSPSPRPQAQASNTQRRTPSMNSDLELESPSAHSSSTGIVTPGRRPQAGAPLSAANLGRITAQQASPQDTSYSLPAFLHQPPPPQRPQGQNSSPLNRGQGSQYRAGAQRRSTSMSTTSSAREIQGGNTRSSPSISQLQTNPHHPPSNRGLSAPSQAQGPARNTRSSQPAGQTFTSLPDPVRPVQHRQNRPSNRTSSYLGPALAIASTLQRQAQPAQQSSQNTAMSGRSSKASGKKDKSG